MTNIEKGLAEFKADTKESLERLESKFDKFIEASENRFAAKWAEQAIKWTVISVVGTLLVYAVKVLITKNPNI